MKMLTINELRYRPKYLTIYAIPKAVPKLLGFTRTGIKVHTVMAYIQYEIPIISIGITPIYDGDPFDHFKTNNRI